MSKQVAIDPFDLPPVPECNRPRRIYFNTLTPDEENFLFGQGYLPIMLPTMSRATDAEHVDYLLAKCQAMEEGTIAFNRDQRLALVSLMQAYGLLDKQHRILNLNCDVSGDTLQEILDWGQSRHTLAGNSTVQNIPKLEKKNERLRPVEGELREVDSK